MDAQQFERMRHYLQETDLTYDQIAKELGYAPGTLSKYAHKYGIKTGRKEARAKITPEISETIRRLMRQGKTITEVAAITGIKYGTIHRHLHPRTSVNFKTHLCEEKTFHYDYGAALYARRAEVCREKDMTDDELTAWINTPRGEAYFFGY